MQTFQKHKGAHALSSLDTALSLCTDCLFEVEAELSGRISILMFQSYSQIISSGMQYVR